MKNKSKFRFVKVGDFPGLYRSVPEGYLIMRNLSAGVVPT